MIRVQQSAEIDHCAEHQEIDNERDCKLDKVASLIAPEVRFDPCCGLAGSHGLTRTVAVLLIVIDDGIPGQLKRALKVPEAVTVTIAAQWPPPPTQVAMGPVDDVSTLLQAPPV
jgi:hypothetical protein